METYSDDPGNVSASFWRLIRYNPKYYVLWIAFGAVGWMIGVRIPNMWIAVGALSISVLAISFYHSVMKNQFREGDSNIGKIIRPGMIAVPINLRMSWDGPAYASIKVVKKPIPAVGPVTGEVGTYVPTVSLYTGPRSGEDHWTDAKPLPLTAGTADAAMIEHHLSKLDWQKADLDRRLTVLCPDDDIASLEPGLYPIDEDQLAALEPAEAIDI